MFKINEELNIRKNKKIRDAIHDIVMNLEKDEYYELDVISNMLRFEYNIFLTPLLLERFLVMWKEEKDSIFDKKDTGWLMWDGENKKIFNARKNKNFKDRLGKSRRVLYQNEKDEKIKGLRKTGWVKLSDNRFVYKGIVDFKIDDNDKINISKYEKERYEEGENPITLELIKKLLISVSPQEHLDLFKDVNLFIKEKRIKSSHNNGKGYYYESFRYLNDLVNKHGYKYVKNWIELYGPSILKEGQLKKSKRENYENERNKDILKYLITDRNKNEMDDNLYKLIHPNNRYYVLLAKFEKTSKIYKVKKIIFGFLSISEKKYPDGYYKIVVRENRNSDDIIFFDTLKHVEYMINGGFNTDDGHIINIFDEQNFDNLKIFFKELKRYKDWDEFLNVDIVNNLKSDF